MKKIILIALAIVSFQFVKAQNETSFKRNYFTIGGSFGESLTNQSYFMTYEYKLKNESTVGINLYHKNFVSNFAGNPKEYGFKILFNHDWSKTIGLNTDKFDIYTGLNAGYSFLNEAKKVDFAYFEDEFIRGGQLGIRYFITKKIGINTELQSNSDNLELKAGLTFRF